MKKNFLLFAFLFTVACQSANTSIDAQKLDFQNMELEHLIWVGDKLVALKNSPVEYLEEGANYATPLIFSGDSTCIHSTKYFATGSLPDGRLEVWKQCLTDPETKTTLMAYDWLTGTLTEVATNLPLGSGPSTWNPEQTIGIVFLDNKYDKKTLYVIKDNQPRSLNVTISVDNVSWNTSNFYPSFSDAKETNTGNTGLADWSNDGKSIAFFASTESIEKEGLNRMYAEYKLYIMDAKKYSTLPVVENIYFPSTIKWSPNSDAIVFIGEYGTEKKEGLWLYSISKKVVLEIENGKFQDVIWDKEGTYLIAIKCKSHDICSDVYKYNISELTN